MTVKRTSLDSWMDKPRDFQLTHWTLVMGNCGGQILNIINNKKKLLINELKKKYKLIDKDHNH